MTPRQRHVFVVGSINQDLVLCCDRIPGEGETRAGSDLRFLPGGKGANQAIAVRRYLPPETSDATVTFVGQVGDDAFGRSLVDYLQSQGLQLEIRVDRAVATGTAVILVEASGRNRILLHPGANGTLAVDSCQSLDRLRPGDLLLLQNEIHWPATLAAMSAGRERGSFIIFNPAPACLLSTELLSMVDLLVVNETEYLTVLEERLDLEAGLEELERQVRERRAKVSCDLLVTLGDRGAILAGRAGAWRVQGHAVQAVDTTGAGDCFVGAFAAALARDLDPGTALEFANRAAALSVTRSGASVSFPALDEVCGADL